MSRAALLLNVAAMLVNISAYVFVGQPFMITAGILHGAAAALLGSV